MHVCVHTHIITFMLFLHLFLYFKNHQLIPVPPAHIRFILVFFFLFFHNCNTLFWVRNLASIIFNGYIHFSIFTICSQHPDLSRLIFLRSHPSLEPLTPSCSTAWLASYWMPCQLSPDAVWLTQSHGPQSLPDSLSHPGLSNTFFKSHFALAGVAQWIKHQPANQRVPSSIPSQGTCLAWGSGPQ